jgi:hypothetical protein
MTEKEQRIQLLVSWILEFENECYVLSDEQKARLKEHEEELRQLTQA